MTIGNNYYSLAIKGDSAGKLFGAKYRDTVYDGEKARGVVKKIFRFLVANPLIRTIYISLDTGAGLLAGIAAFKYKQKFGKKSLKVICCMPGTDFISRLSREELLQFTFIGREVADETRLLSKDRVSAKSDAIIDKFLVENCEALLTVWDGRSYRSKVHSAVMHATKNDRAVYNINYRYDDVEGIVRQSVEKPIEFKSSKVRTKMTVQEQTDQYLQEAYASDI